MLHMVYKLPNDKLNNRWQNCNCRSLLRENIKKEPTPSFGWFERDPNTTYKTQCKKSYYVSCRVTLNMFASAFLSAFL